MIPSVEDGGIGGNVGLGSRDSDDILDACLEGISQEKRLVGEVRNAIVRSDEDPLHLVFLEPVGINHGPILLDHIDVVELGELLGGTALEASGQGDDTVLSERARREFLRESLSYSLSGVTSRSDDEDSRTHYVGLCREFALVALCARLFVVDGK